MLYHLYELNHAAVAPLRLGAQYASTFWQTSGNPMSDSPMGRSMVAGLDMFERLTRRYDKPEFGIEEIFLNDQSHEVRQETVFEKPPLFLTKYFLLLF